MPQLRASLKLLEIKRARLLGALVVRQTIRLSCGEHTAGEDEKDEKETGEATTEAFRLPREDQVHIEACFFACRELSKK